MGLLVLFRNRMFNILESIKLKGDLENVQKILNRDISEMDGNYKEDYYVIFDLLCSQN